MQHGIITAQIKRKVTDYGSNTKLIGTDHQPYGDDNKPVESSLAGKIGFKMAQNIFNKI